MAGVLEKRVARGARVLDRQVPGWADRIDGPAVRMAGGSSCILGQLFGDYTDGARELGLRSDGHPSDLDGQPVAYGFHLPHWPDRDDPYRETWEALGDAWRAAVRERQAA